VFPSTAEQAEKLARPPIWVAQRFERGDNSSVFIGRLSAAEARAWRSEEFFRKL